MLRVPAQPQPGVARAQNEPLDVVVVHYETPHLLERCLRSIFLHSSDSVRSVIVVDNSITAAPTEDVVAAFPDVRLLRPSTNIGYGAGANRGVAECTAEHVLVLNADTELRAGAAHALVDELDRHPECAVVGPRLVDHNGRSQPSCARFPTCSGVLLHETGVWKLAGWGSFGAPMRPFYEVRAAGDVPWLLGAALAFRRWSFLAVGGFDPVFFMYYEEVDLCRRLQTAGASTRYVPMAVVVHVGGASTSQQPIAAERTMYRSLATYQRRHGADSSLSCLRIVVLVVAVVRSVGDVVRALLRWRLDAVRPAIAGWATIAGDAVRTWRP